MAHGVSSPLDQVKRHVAIESKTTPRCGQPRGIVQPLAAASAQTRQRADHSSAPVSLPAAKVLELRAGRDARDGTSAANWATVR